MLQQLRRSHLAPQHPPTLLPHLGCHLAAFHADGCLCVLHGHGISVIATFAHRKTPRITCEESGACGRTRTGDLLITSELLYQLSHTSASSADRGYYISFSLRRQLSFFSLPPPENTVRILSSQFPNISPLAPFFLPALRPFSSKSQERNPAYSAVFAPQTSVPPYPTD